MRPLLATFPAVLILSACAQSAVLANKDCNDGTLRRYEPVIAYNNFGNVSLPPYGFSTFYEPMGGRFDIKPPDCARAQPPQPLSADPSKVGGAAVEQQTASVRTCPRSRA